MDRSGKRRVTLEERAGRSSPPPVWEQSVPAVGRGMAPRQRHVWAFVLDEWVQALAVEVRREPSGWSVRVAYVMDGGVLREEWVDQRFVRVT